VLTHFHAQIASSPMKHPCSQDVYILNPRLGPTATLRSINKVSNTKSQQTRHLKNLLITWSRKIGDTISYPRVVRAHSCRRSWAGGTVPTSQRAFIMRYSPGQLSRSQRANKFPLKRVCPSVRCFRPPDGQTQGDQIEPI
jgi:hypothetical protein